MNQDDIICMAREAGFVIRMAREAGFADRQWSAMFFESGPYEIVTPTEALKRFFLAAAAAGAAAEREACAKACEEIAQRDETGYGIAEDCAVVIRARGSKE